eukprot:15026233-Alexandrium_andersonii.AAC.1
MTALWRAMSPVPKMSWKAFQCLLSGSSREWANKNGRAGHARCTRAEQTLKCNYWQKEHRGLGAKRAGRKQFGNPAGVLLACGLGIGLYGLVGPLVD